MEQRSIEWYKARLGKITGSQVWCLMKQPRSKTETFTDTAKTYLYELAAERRINDTYLNQSFDEWLSRTNVETYAMRYGTETEELARQCYEMHLPAELTVKETGFCIMPTLENYGDSPDGVVYNRNSESVGVLEIKCPNPATFMKYRHQLQSGISLKEVEEKYYWQCLSHMMCAGAVWCDFVIFDKMLQDGYYCQRIEYCESDILDMRVRIKDANEFIKSIIA